MSNSHPLEIVARGSEAQLQASEKSIHDIVSINTVEGYKKEKNLVMFDGTSKTNDSYN